MKVCVIGGGSTYTPELVEGLLERRGALGLTELHLVDHDAQRLAVLGPLAERMAAAAAASGGEDGEDGEGGPVRVRWGTDRRAGIAGSRFVVSQIRVGGMAARERDEQLGREFGLIGQETVGIGGFANALRTIPVALEIAADIAELAPDAILLNFTNPAGLVTEALCRHSAVRTIGLCNVPWTMRARLARVFGAAAEEVELDYVGLNHLSWVRGVTVRGEDVTERALAAFAGASERSSDDQTWTDRAAALLQAIPNYYLRYYYDTAAMLHHQQTHPTRASEVAAIEAALLAQYADPELREKPAELTRRGGAYYSVAAAALMADLVAGSGVTHVVNVPNAGAIPGLDDDVVVEVGARIDATGATTLPVAPLRADVDALLRTVKDAELLTVQAAVHGDERAALLALVTNPIGPPLDRADDVWRRLRELNAGALGRLG